MASIERLPLTDGPSRDGLCDALKYAFDEQNPHTVVFCVADCHREAVITGLRHWDGDSIRHWDGDDLRVNAFEFVGRIEDKSVEGVFPLHMNGLFDYRSRRGYIQVSSCSIGFPARH